MNNLIIYGAVTPPRRVQAQASWRKRVRTLADRIRANIGISNHLNYRNLVATTSFNRGDLSIALGAEASVRQIDPNAAIEFKEWGEIHNTAPRSNLLFAGGGYFFVDDQGLLPERINRDLEMLVSAGVKYGILGAGLNHVSERLDRDGRIDIASSQSALLSRLLNGAQFASVRDQQSLDTLQPFTDRPLFLFGDPALYLPASLPFTRNSNRKFRIGINIPFHGPAANQRVQRDLKQYITFFRQLHQATGADLHFMVHFDSEVLIADILRDAGLPITTINSDVSGLQAAYAQLDMHVGGMLHSCILACSVGTPCVAMAYDIKHFGFFELMQLSDLCLPAAPFDATIMLHKSLEVLERRLDLRMHIDRRRETLRELAKDYLSANLPMLLNP